MFATTLRIAGTSGRSEIVFENVSSLVAAHESRCCGCLNATRVRRSTLLETTKENMAIRCTLVVRVAEVGPKTGTSKTNSMPELSIP